MMAVPFPAVQPSSRRFVAPRWPITSTRSQSGVVSKRRWGNRPGDGQLSLSFTNIRDDIAAEIVEAYDNAMLSSKEVELPPEVFQGTAGKLNTYLRERIPQQGMRWFFREDEPPEVESVVPGISSVRVTLAAELRMD
jgi:hypothetical protein